MENIALHFLFDHFKNHSISQSTFWQDLNVHKKGVYVSLPYGDIRMCVCVCVCVRECECVFGEKVVLGRGYGRCTAVSLYQNV